MLVKGFRFGMLLQFAVGPVCVYVFNQASSVGLIDGMAAAAGVTLGDMLYIYLAIMGISKIVDFEKYKKPFTILGAAVILYFSIDIFLSTLWSISIIPKLMFASGGTGSFIQAFVLTVSSPITILFWSGVFTVKVIEEKMGKTDLVKFASGAILSTVFFLSLTSVLGVLLHSFLPGTFIKALNIAVAVVLVCFAISKLISIKKDDESVKMEDY